MHFDWVPPAPPPEALSAALRRLVQLEALDTHSRLTTVGSFMSELPLPPHLARILIASTDPRFACAQEVLSILAMQQITDPFFDRQSTETQLSIRRFAAQEGDALTLLNVYNAFTGVGGASARWCRRHRLNSAALSRAVSIRSQLLKFVVRFGLDPASSVLGTPNAVERVSRCLITGLYGNLARYDQVNMIYTHLDGTPMHVHPTSVFFNTRPGKQWAVYGQATDQGDKTYVRDLMVVELEWVVEVVPGVYNVSTNWGGGGATLVHTSGDGDMSNL